MKYAKYGIILLIAFLLNVLVAQADPGIVVSVDAIVNTVAPGGTATYKVRVQSITDELEHIVLSIDNPRVGWTYTFSQSEFDLDPGATVEVDLSITVPVGTSIGTYYHDVKGDAYLPGFEFLGSVETSTYTNVETIAIPEYPTIALPVMIVLGLVFGVSRIKNREK